MAVRPGKLYVGNIAWSETEASLVSLFSEFDAHDAKIITDRDTGKSRGFAFIEVNDVESAINAINGTTVAGRVLTVNEAKPREPRRFNN